jgi:hypothetical protein
MIANQDASRKLMTFARRLSFYCMMATGACVVAQIGLLFCFFTHEWFGKFVYLPFFWASSWPNMLFQPFLNRTLPDVLQGLGWPINCFISLVGWLALACLAAISVHGTQLLRRSPSKE